MRGFEGGFLTARSLKAIEMAPRWRLSVQIEILESWVNMSQENFLLSEMNWPKKSILTVPAIFRVMAGAMAK